jgi:hypothetical protein
MRCSIEEAELDFYISFVAETVEEAATLVRMGMMAKHRKHIVDVTCNVSKNEIENSILLGKKKDISYLRMRNMPMV